MTSKEDNALSEAETPEQVRLRKEQKHLENRRTLIKAITRVLLIASVFVVVGFILNKNIGDVHSAEELGQRIRAVLHPPGSFSGQLKSYTLFILGSAFLVGLGMPRWISAFAGGMLYGAVLGTGLALLAALAGASVTYFIARSMLSSTVRSILGKRYRPMKDRFQRNAFGYTLHLRLFPISNATLTSLACGACRVPFSKYTLANIIGFVPQTIIFALFGSGAIKGSSSQFAIGVALYILLVLMHWAYRSRSKRLRLAETA